MRIQEELEVPHAEKLAAARAETEKMREMFYNIRREHELLKTEFEQFTVDQGKEAEAVHESHNVSALPPCSLLAPSDAR